MDARQRCRYGTHEGLAAAMTMLPVVPDYVRYPTGRDARETQGELACTVTG